MGVSGFLEWGHRIGLSCLFDEIGFHQLYHLRNAEASLHDAHAWQVIIFTDPNVLGGIASRSIYKIKEGTPYLFP